MSNELSNFDIIDIIKDYKLDYCFGGVYSKDQLPKELIRTKFYIVNMQDHDKVMEHTGQCFITILH